MFLRKYISSRNEKKHKFWYDCAKPKYNEKTKLCYIDTDSFIVHVKTEDIYEDIAKERPLPKGKNKKVIRLMKDELRETIMKEFVELRAKS